MVLLSRLRGQLARRRKIQALRRAGQSSPVRLVVGSAGIAPAGWTASDADYLNLLDRAQWERCFSPGSIDVIVAEHVWEHLDPAEGLAAAQTCFHYLRSGGRLRVAVPDGHHPDPAYRDWVRPGGNGPGAADHKVLYTRETLSALLEGAGFLVHPLECFDAEGGFHQLPWLDDDGLIRRSFRHDPRNLDGRPHFTSLIIDGLKPQP